MFDRIFISLVRERDTRCFADIGLGIIDEIKIVLPAVTVFKREIEKILSRNIFELFGNTQTFFRDDGRVFGNFASDRSHKFLIFFIIEADFCLLLNDFQNAFAADGFEFDRQFLFETFMLKR